MKTFDDERRIVPRWRTLSAARRNRELESVGNRRGERSVYDPDWLSKKAARFDQECSIESAHELLSAAIVAGADDLARAAAFFLADAPDVNGIVRTFASERLESTASSSATSVQPSTDEAIHIARTWLREHPRDAVSWTELGLYFATVGQLEKARDCVRVALALAPSSRYVLRSTTRYFLHEGNPDEAAFFLERSMATKHDPWLAAAQLAVMEIMGRRPTHMRRIKALLDMDADDRSLSELRCALGSFEYREGSRRKARRLFLDSLRDPSENVIAHLNWYRRENRILLYLPVDMGKYAESPEGEVWSFAADGRWPAAINACWNWTAVEPYSVRPYLIGSYWACVTENDPKHAIRFCEKGLRANPNNLGLLNNMAFSYGRLGLLDEGEASYRKARHALRQADDEVGRLALEGLWAYRAGDVPVGRARYAQAISACKEAVEVTDRYRLVLHWMEEEVDSGADGARRAAMAAAKVDDSTGGSEVEVMRSRVVQKARSLTDDVPNPHVVAALRSADI